MSTPPLVATSREEIAHVKKSISERVAYLDKQLNATVTPSNADALKEQVQELRAMHSDLDRALTKSGITIYTTPGCPGCKLTIDRLNDAGVHPNVIDLSQRPDLVSKLQQEGLRQAPIIETTDGKRTSGFNMDRVREAQKLGTPTRDEAIVRPKRIKVTR